LPAVPSYFFERDTELFYCCIINLLALQIPNNFLDLIFQASYDNAGLDRYHSPGAGASTPWFNRSSTAMWDIEAGSELFVDYGQGKTSRLYAQLVWHFIFSFPYRVLIQQPFTKPRLVLNARRHISVSTYCG
jgi:hypothetical protein